MEDYEAKQIASAWGVKLSEAGHTGGMACCGETLYAAMGGNFQNMAKYVVGFTKDAQRSPGTLDSLAVICLCPKCHNHYWYHITAGMIFEFAKGCPEWPADQKEKLRE
jgi:hypothetical protein